MYSIFNIKVLCWCHKPYNDNINYMLTSNNHSSIYNRCYINLCFIPRNRRSTSGPTYHKAHNYKCCARAAQKIVLIVPQFTIRPKPTVYRLTDCWLYVSSLTAGVQCHCLKNWISHWWNDLSFLRTTLMQDAPHIAGYEYDFTWLFTLETSYSIFVQWEGTTKSTTVV